ncbi:MAG TPA: hydroxymethylpyrimidine/phosphomethylpyrimidine kinase, partial [Polyangiaceae bacterium]|nr:hydroxymethylpyrimidine/phosphomethylpyrimidine kinase [Polyangiaceae bacterium]
MSRRGAKTGAAAPRRAGAAAAPRRASALSIAGLDPSGGAGMAADLRAFGAAGAWGCAVCAVVTVQSTAGLRSAHPLDPELVTAQAEEVLANGTVRALKTGALGSSANVRAVAAIVRARPRLPAVVDPVMIATRAPGGARLLDGDALEAMRELCSLAALVTPNVDEAEALTEGRVRDRQDQREAARLLVGRGARAALVKGGHLEGDPDAADVLAVGDRVLTLRTRRLEVAPFHGGGCTLAALV